SARMPDSIRWRLEAGRAGEIEETPKPGDRLFDRVRNVVIGNNALVTDAAAATARRLGYRTDVMTRELQGEARDVARDFVARARPAPAPRVSDRRRGDDRDGSRGREGGALSGVRPGRRARARPVRSHHRPRRRDRRYRRPDGRGGRDRER